MAPQSLHCPYNKIMEEKYEEPRSFNPLQNINYCITLGEWMNIEEILFIHLQQGRNYIDSKKYLV